MKIFYHEKTASMLFVTLVATGIFITILSGAISLGLLQGKLNKVKVIKSQALHIAEAGVNYYRWVLYHNPYDFCNSNGNIQACISGPEYGPYGPYEYSDSIDGSIKGYYNLYITPPAQNSSNIVIIKSVGWVDGHPNIKRTIEVKCSAVPWSSYAILSDSDIYFDENTEIWGPIHSNNGIRFDGIAHGVISSALLEYDDKTHIDSPGGLNENNEYAVHTHKDTVDPLPPQELPARPDVFMAGRLFPVPRLSFDLLDQYVYSARQLALEDDGLFLPSSSGMGYHITFTSDKMNVKVVNSLTAPCDVCVGGRTCIQGNINNCKRWICVGGFESTQTYGISSESNPPISLGIGNGMNIDIPANGIIFVEDNVWVEGTVNGGRVAILAFKDENQGIADIIINNNLEYNENLPDPQNPDVVGLIAQGNIKIGLYSGNQLHIDSAMIAKGGRIGRDYFEESCSSVYNIRSKIQIFGSLATKNGYGFSYTYPSNSGYQNIEITFDNNLRLKPPPHFPLSGEYRFMSWREN